MENTIANIRILDVVRLVDVTYVYRMATKYDEID
jgi:hypothetical protein